MEAVRYAERWWNSFNPEYKQFDNNCTNFISQCLHVGGIPMTGHPNRSKRWWYQNNQWSYSWTVAHAFRWYLSG
ncbi:amidase domain-containing protein, partial [Pseudomonas sp. 2822-15]|uniref:amidase domain-containing protein n=1 Tax=Pseudomonas sp. 2822-15 TaxID=1712677 RepID=UPI0035321D0B